MTLITTFFAHIRLTVTDIDRYRRFYEAVFGWPVAVEVPPDADDATRESLAFLFGGVIYQVGGSLLGRRPVAADRFDEDRVGLDHLSFAVAAGRTWSPRWRTWTAWPSRTARSATSAPATSWSSATRTTSPWSCSRRRPRCAWHDVGELADRGAVDPHIPAVLPEERRRYPGARTPEAVRLYGDGRYRQCAR